MKYTRYKRGSCGEKCDSVTYYVLTTSKDDRRRLIDLKQLLLLCTECGALHHVNLEDNATPKLEEEN